jgi:hypothetical protein
MQPRIQFLFSYFSQIYNPLYNGAISKYVVRKDLCGVIIQWWFSYMYLALCCAEWSSNDDSPICTLHYVVRSDHPMMILLYVPCIMLWGAIIKWWFSYIYAIIQRWFSYIYRALCFAKRSSSDDSPIYTRSYNDDYPIYTVHYVVRSDHQMMILLYIRDHPKMILLYIPCIILCGVIIQWWFSYIYAITQWWFSYIYRALCCAERSSNDDSPIYTRSPNDDSPMYTVHYVMHSDHQMMILLYIPCIMLCGAIIKWWFSYIYRALCCAERSSNDDSPIYTVHYVVRSDHQIMILLYTLYCPLCCAERSSNDDSPCIMLCVPLFFLSLVL